MKNVFRKSNSKPVVLILSDIYKETVRSQAYLGKKGYTIPKTAITPQDYEAIKIELFMKPFTMGPQTAGGDTAFPIYRENNAKIYLPRFYGISRYGLPNRSELALGEDIQVDFVKDLRDYQIKIAKIYTDYTNKPICKGGSNSGGGAILEVPCGRGKTVIALNIITRIKKKALILVHKEFLMNQWIERIAEFVPSARVGRIQGPTFDVDGKDIVIGMIQTLHSRDFPQEAFEPFGITIVDEVHRIGSEEFSKTLFKIVTPYMLGISATVERKDRLTKILYWFIGDKIYSEERADDDIVQVRGIQFKTADNEFNETEYDFRGAPKYSTMITKLCQYGPRSDFIIRILSDLLQENPNKQIMVLAHNRELLTYLHDAIKHKISDAEDVVGYYVGGMKERDLKITETRKIVLATFAMAAEALDIKTLSTLLMATPKTDIEQSVGRILRAKGQNPIVVDIYDSHDYLKRQWNTRKTFYKKCNYRIQSIRSDEYRDFKTGWKVEFEPTCKAVGAVEKKQCMINIPKEVLEAEPV